MNIIKRGVQTLLLSGCLALGTIGFVNQANAGYVSLYIGPQGYYDDTYYSEGYYPYPQVIYYGGYYGGGGSYYHHWHGGGHGNWHGGGGHGGWHGGGHGGHGGHHH